MALIDDATRKRKRRTREDTDTSELIYSPPKHSSASGLFDPTMVTVEVSDESEDSLDRDWTQKFVLPLDLISTQSPYFKRMFEGNFTEATQGSVNLRDVSPWIFRVFVGLMYRQRIFYEPQSKTAHRFDTPPAKASVKRAKTKKSTKAAAALEEPAEPETHHPPGGNRNKLSQGKTVESGDTAAPDECEYDDPTTWPWDWLFKLYIFADKYDIRDLRMKTFDIIQMKTLQAQPRRYLLPSTSQVVYAVERLPVSSPLYRFLVYCWANWLSVADFGANEEKQLSSFESLPAHFLSRCLLASKRTKAAMRCRACKADGSGAKCDEKNHVKDDRLHIIDRDYCDFHEHGGDDEERARCCLRWELVGDKMLQ